MNDDKKGRAFWHDYRARCIYFITMNKVPETPSFGKLPAIHAGACAQPGSVRIDLSPLGKLARNAIFNISKIEPKIRLFQYVVMPDHVHFLISVEEVLNEPLGKMIARLKAAINQEADKAGVFQAGYNDQILRRDRDLNVIFKYIRENPWRLAVRRAYPEYFQRVNALKIGDKTYQAYGNFQLLDNPFKEQVVIHRADTPEVRERNRQEWLYTASNGGVLVSPFISPAEKAIRAEAEACGGRFILITNETFGDRYKPAAHDFALCEAGHLLIISANLPATLTRQTCLAMNALAARLRVSAPPKICFR